MAKFFILSILFLSLVDYGYTTQKKFLSLEEIEYLEEVKYLIDSNHILKLYSKLQNMVT